MNILVAMSGGIDSSVVAGLLINSGHNVIGATLRTLENSDSIISDAEYAAKNLGISHYVIDVRKEFRESVIDNFISEYNNGRTPNPCVFCNKNIKFPYMIAAMNRLNCDQIATGHYVEKNYDGNEYYLSRGKDSKKDQSYMLYGLTQEILSKSIFPLGNYTKTEVRALAATYNLKIQLSKKESTDTCFNKNEVLSATRPGNFIYNGKIVGKHNGIVNYTIGQKKGIGLCTPEGSLVVCNLNVINNEIVLGHNNELLKNQVNIQNVNWMKKNYNKENLKACVRYHSETVPCSFENDVVIFEYPVGAPAPGQSLVFYNENDVVGGGIIC